MRLNQELEFMLQEIHRALEHYLYPACNRCKSKSVHRSCNCKEASDEGK